MYERLLQLGGLDIAACEAAGLAHDVGHPPFGHIAEGVLDRWLKDRGVEDGFEGNAQSMRTLVALSPKDDLVRSLQLTNVTLAAVAKYPWLRDESNDKTKDKFNFYKSEAAVLKDCRSWFLENPTFSSLHGDRRLTQTVEASVMDLADDITYAVHDLEDFLGAQIINPAEAVERLEAASVLMRLDPAGASPLSDERRRRATGYITTAEKASKYYAGYFDEREYRTALEGVTDWFRRVHFPQGHFARQGAIRREMSSLITSFASAIRVQGPEWEHGPSVYLDSFEWHRMLVFKQVTRAHVVNTPLVGLHQRAQEQSLLVLLNALHDWAEGSGGEEHFLPPALAGFRDRFGTSRQEAARAIADYVCTLSDKECHDMSRWVSGQSLPRVTH